MLRLAKLLLIISPFFTFYIKTLVLSSLFRSSHHEQVGNFVLCVALPFISFVYLSNSLSQVKHKQYKGNSLPTWFFHLVSNWSNPLPVISISWAFVFLFYQIKNKCERQWSFYLEPELPCINSDLWNCAENSIKKSDRTLKRVQSWNSNFHRQQL